MTEREGKGQCDMATKEGGEASGDPHAQLKQQRGLQRRIPSSTFVQSAFQGGEAESPEWDGMEGGLWVCRLD